MREQLKLEVYQTKAIKWLLDKSSSGLFLDMGLGKTVCVLTARLLLKKKMLVIGPLKVIQNAWPREIEKWDIFRTTTYTILHGKDKWKNILRDVDVYLLNYEGIPWYVEFCKKNSLSFDCEILCFDELHKMKDWNSRRLHEIKPALKFFQHRWGLTGTPAPNGLQDIFAQTYCIDLGNTFGPHITPFRMRYTEKNPYTFKVKIKNQECEEEIYQKLSTIFFRMDAEDYISLPTVKYCPIYFELPEKLYTKYKQLEDDFITELHSSEFITAVHAGALSQKLRQFLSGRIYTEQRDLIYVHNLKYELLEETIDSFQGSPILIGYQYTHEKEILKQKYGSEFFFDVDGKELDRRIERWNKGKMPYGFGHPASAGLGLNLQEASHKVLFFSLDFNLGNYQQFIARIARRGQKEEHVNVYSLIGRKTIDEHIFSSLGLKENGQSLLLNRLRELQK